MSEPEVLDGHAEEVGTELAPSQALSVTPQVQATELVKRLAVIREAMEQAMTEGLDYGVIPGTDKPALLKPGAEKLGTLFQLDVQVTNEKHWGPGEHLTVVSHATVYHAPSGLRLGSGEGICTTRERKYAYRKQERTCPVCGAAAVIKGKAEYGGGWLCWRKRGGCGAKFPEGDPSVEGQQVGEVDNPDLPDVWNTILKMAKKRAHVDAVLAVTGASALFTQDIEPDAGDPPSEAAAAPQEAQKAPQTRDVERTGESDIPSEDVWLSDTLHLLHRLGWKGGDIRCALQSIGVENLEGSTWSAVLARLEERHRLLLSALLAERLAEGTPLETAA